MGQAQLSQALEEAKVAIQNALNDATILAALTAYGYDETRLQEGQALYEEAMALYEAQIDTYGKQFASTEALEAERETVKAEYTLALQIARRIFKDNVGARQSMELDGHRAHALSGQLTQMETFYANLLKHPDWVEAMSRFGFDEARIQTELDRVRNLSALDQTQEDAKGEAQRSTEQRDAKFAELREWMALFRTVAEHALADDPQKLESLGFGSVPEQID